MHRSILVGWVGRIEWEVSLDDTVVRTDQHAAGRGAIPARRPQKGLLNPEGEALGRSRGGFWTKLHLPAAVRVDRSRWS